MIAVTGRLIVVAFGSWVVDSFDSFLNRFDFRERKILMGEYAARQKIRCGLEKSFE
jgi:hypothetical protein